MRIITSSRKDDVLRRKAEYEQQLKDYNERMNQRHHAFNEAEVAVMKPIQEFLESRLSAYSALQFDVRVERYFGKTLRVRIECNERAKFSDDVALAWSYDASIADGEVVKESSSWSGLKATTPNQMRSLRQTVSALEFLNDLDWYRLINVTLPKYEDYYPDDDKRPVAPDFDAELVEAEIEDIIGQNKAILVKNWGDACPYRGDVFLKVNGQSASQYQVDMVGCNRFTDDMNAISEEAILDFKAGHFRSQRVRKSSVKLVTPICVIDLD